MIFSMPVLWRYLTGQFLKVFFLAASTLILCLLTLRLEDIAHFISHDTSRSFIIWFVFYQIPYILPVAIPLSCLISSMILIQRLSSDHEIVALRALGYSLKAIFTPLLLVAVFISLLNFLITSELATKTHLKTNLLKADLVSLNPLFMLNNKHFMRIKGFYFDALGPSKMGELASDVVVALPSKKGGRMNLIVAKKLEAKEEAFMGHHLTLISTLESPTIDSPTEKGGARSEKVLIENIGHTFSDNHGFADLFQRKAWSLNDDFLGFKSLWLRWEEMQKEGHQDSKKLGRTQSRLIAEMARRFSLGLSPLTFTLLGLAFGLILGRHQSYRGLAWVTALATLFLTTFFLAKGVDHKLYLSLSLYGLPHLIIILLSLRQIRRINLGYSA